MEFEITPRKKFSFGLPELWEYRELFYFFIWRDVKIKYKQTLLGFAWAIFQPLLLMLILSLFFHKLIQNAEQKVPYAAFSFSGLILWNVFANGLSSASNSMIANTNIIKKIYFPRLIIPFSAVLVALFDFIMAFLVFVGILIYYGIEVSPMKILAFFPVSLLLLLFTTIGLGSLSAALAVKYRDFKYIIPFFIQILFFITPVIYPPGLIEHELLKKLLFLNPVSSSIDLFRHAFFDVPLNWEGLYISASISVIAFFAGIIYFRKTESYFADIS